MGKKIQDLLDYGSFDADKKLADLFEVSKNTGTSLSPIYPADATGSRSIRVDTLIQMLGIPCKVTDAGTIALLVNDSNWTNNYYTGSAITSGQKAGDWYDSGTIRYLFITGTTASRIPYSLL